MKQKGIITGASRGIGLAIAKKLAKEGCILTLVASKEGSFDHCRTLFDEKTTFFVGLDITQDVNQKELIQVAQQKMGGIDFLINNAGMAFGRSYMETTQQEWDDIMDLNAKTPYFLTQKMVPILEKSKTPTVINISSVVGHKGYANQSAYTASKHALAGWTSAFAKEVATKNIRVHMISPGGVATEMVEKTRPDLQLDELIQPDEIADVIWFLMTHRKNGVIDQIHMRRATNLPFA